MLSINFIRKNKEKVKKAAKDKNRPVEIDKIISLDNQKKELTRKEQNLRQQRNLLAKQGNTPQSRKKGKKIKEELKKITARLKTIREELEYLLGFVPNIPLEEIPVGKDESANIEIKKWGILPQFNFPPRSHIELGQINDIIDLKRGVKVSGFRGYFLKNEAAVLHMAILLYAFQKLIKKGYTPIIAPAIVKGFTLFGSGQFPWGKKEVYKLNDNDNYLAGTAETPMTAYHSGEILDEKRLPKKYAAFSPCFRKEAGSYGKDLKGIYRVHEFWKVEQLVISRNNLKEAKELHRELQENTEEILKNLKLPYRVLLMATGDMGEPQIKKYDTEVWMPYRHGYGEVASNSIMGDFQARRLNIKFRDKNNKTQFCFTLNNTALASPRILVALLENYQQKDGSVLIPPVLQPLTGFKKISKK